MPNATHETAAVVWVEAWDGDPETLYEAGSEPADPVLSCRFPVSAECWARYEAARDAFQAARDAMETCAFNHRRAGAAERAERARAASVAALRAAGYTVTEPKDA